MANDNGHYEVQRELLTPELQATSAAMQAEAVISLPERADRLNEALNYYDTAVLLESELRKFQEPEWFKKMQQRFGANVVYKMRRQKMEKHQLVLDTAQDEFKAAYGEYEGVDEAYQSFELTFRGSSEARKVKRDEMRATYATQIMGEVAVAQQTEQADEEEMHVLDPTAKISLTRALRPSFRRLSAGDYETITEADLRLAGPPALLAELVGNSAGLNSYFYNEVNGRDLKTIHMTFTPSEASTVILRTSPVYPARQALNLSETAQRERPIDEHDADAPRRAAIHYNEQLASGMTEYARNTLDPQLDLIARFKEASRFHGGLARFGNEANMESQLDYFWDVVVADMLWAIRVNGKKDPQYEEDTQRALIKAVHFADDKDQRLARFGLLLDVCEQWIAAKKNYMISKTAQANRFIYDNQTPEERDSRADQSLHPVT